jgi:hypothetical protein
MSTTNQDKNYTQFCDNLYKKWKQSQLTADLILTKLFQIEYAPEPYFVLKQGKRPLHVLLTNPGSGMDFQHISEHKNVEYKNFAAVLGSIYTSDSFKKQKGASAAYRRLIKSIEFADYLGYDSVVNIETIPFHSENLNKKEALNAIRQSPTLVAYQKTLKKYLEKKSVMIVSACNSKETISKNSIQKSDWLMYQSDLASIDIKKLKIKPITKKNDKITSALFSYNNKHLVLMMGSNNLPSIY